MKAIIPLVALAIQVATAQSPDSAAVATTVALPTISVDTVALPAATPAPAVAAPAEPATAPVPPPPVVPAAAEPSPVQEAPSKAQVEEDYGRWQLGFGAGMASGSGISLRRWFGDLDAVQLNVAPYVSRTNYPEDGTTVPEGYPQDEGFVLEANVSVGLTWLHEIYGYRIDRTRELKLLSYVAGSAYLSIEQQQMDRWKTAPGETKPTIRYYDDYRREEREFSLGSGVATEFSIWRFSAMLGFGLGGWYETVDENFGLTGDVQIGTHFRF